MPPPASRPISPGWEGSWPRPERPKPQDYRAINAILDPVLRRFRTAADFYEAKIIASTAGWRRITREGEERGEWEVAIKEEWIEYSAVEAVEVGSS